MADTHPFHLYTSEKDKADLPDFQFAEQEDNPALYCPPAGLSDAVNVAIQLGLPLLITGEPGTGKTDLARHLAHYFGLGEPLIYPVQTSSTATDLFYRYDALGHFQHNQNHATALSQADLEKRFIQFNALGKAIKEGKRTVVLIDEIDKAPRDLPNDLLFAIEKLQFKVPELRDETTGEPVEYKTNKSSRPLIILTSNSEKNLPDAFLRRLVYYHIQFDEVDLNLILQKKSSLNATQIEKALAFFKKIRTLKLKKKPATAELIAWVSLLSSLQFPVEKLGTELATKEKNYLDTSFAVLAKTREDLDLLKKM